MRIATWLSVVSLAPALRAQGSANWEFVGAPSISAAGGICCQIAVASDGTPYVSFQDQSTGDIRASVLRFQGGGWSYVGAPRTASVGQAWYNKLALAANGQLYLTCRDYAAGGRLSLRRFDAGANAWFSVGPNGSSPGEAHWTDVAVGPNGEPVVIFADRTTSPIDGATAMRYRAGNWYFLGTFGFSGSTASFPSIAVDGGNAIYAGFSDVNYYDAGTGTGRASVKRFDELTGTWNFVGAPGFSPEGASNMTLAIDRNGAPWIAYYVWHSRIVVMRFDGSAWQRVGVSGSGLDRPEVQTEGWRQWLSLDFDSQDAPYVSYQRWDDGNRAAVRRFDGSDWVPVGALGFTAGGADYLSMAVGPDDVPYVVFRDAANATRVSVMRFAPSPHVYCAAVVNSLGCLPQISARGTPSATSPTPFWIRATSVISHRGGVLLYSSGPDRVPFNGGVLCLRAPLHRGGGVNSGGASPAIDCTGVLERDFNEILRTSSSPDLAPGQRVFAQFYYRDQHNPAGPGLTDAVSFEIEP